ncbi:Asp-tRNA(Asn)/Glu-tRNA(Gln) amidotransferase subunit GatB [Patescibacteria group bacterium]|nr:Asp-tRNA(Asn)/Glu-tRNA(Gln) amidotransferase subunit GatB [Patescibacteria group bacterium]
MYIPTIGLEIHAELKTRTKMFCGCKNDPNEPKPNVNVCPICLGHPGTLPTINKEAVRKMVQIGLALGGEIAGFSQFDRKSYFYPDLPKGYQISQYEFPIVQKGLLNGIRITRVHLEEDAGRLAHENGATLVDYNRASVPLMELVTEPDVKNADEAVAFAAALQQILRYLDASDADMEKGQMRIEANVSIAPEGAGKLGTKVEVKNINSFKAVHDAIEYEVERQSKALDAGEKIKQETRGWDDKRNITVSQRSKDDLNDYRYFPEPDLPPLDVQKAFDVEKLRAELPELPQAKQHRFVQEFGLPQNIVETLTLERPFAEYFEEAASELKDRSPKADYQTLANYLTSDFRGLMKNSGGDLSAAKIPAEHIAHLVALLSDGKLTSRLAKDILAKMFQTGEDPENLMKSEGIELMNDESALGAVADQVIASNPKSVADYRNGKQNALQFLVGQMMAMTKGKAEPNLARKILEEKLK